MCIEQSILAAIGLIFVFIALFVMSDDRVTVWNTYGETQSWNKGRSRIVYSWEELEAKKKLLRGE